MNSESNVESRHGETLLSEIAQETNHRWRSPLCSKEDVTRSVVGVSGGAFSFLFAHCLVPSTSTSLASRHPNTPGNASATSLKLLHTPKRAKSVSCFHCVKRGILGVGTVHGFGPDWVDGRSFA
jgi:hypothetical protein